MKNTTAGRKKIYASFSRALKMQGFAINENIATSYDKKVKVEFSGGEWLMFIDGKLVFSYQMITGSMEKLKQVLKTHGRSSSLKKTTSSIWKKPNIDDLLPNLDRIEIRKFNKQAGLAVTADQRRLKQESPKSEELTDKFISGISKIGFSKGTKDAEDQTWIYDMFTLSVENNVWKLFQADRNIGEGVVSLQSIEIISNILDEI